MRVISVLLLMLLSSLLSLAYMPTVYAEVPLPLAQYEQYMDQSQATGVSTGLDGEDVAEQAAADSLMAAEAINESRTFNASDNGDGANGDQVAFAAPAPVSTENNRVESSAIGESEAGSEAEIEAYETVETASDTINELPDTGGASMVHLGAGILLSLAGTLLFGVSRKGGFTVRGV